MLQRQIHGELDEILAGSADARLMVLGRRGSQNTVGSHLEKVIRLQKKPVMVVPETFTRPSRVMLAYDGSEASLENLLHMAASPLLQGLTCHLVMVNGSDTVLQAALAILQNVGITAQATLLNDDAVTRALCGYADTQNIDLIVMGAWGHSRLRQFFIGSHTTEMLSESRQPLLMLR